MAKNKLTLAKKLITENLKTKNTFLDLGNCGITDLRDLPDLFKCTHLTNLNLGTYYFKENNIFIRSNNKLSRNTIHEIPVEISLLNNLQILSFSENQISEIKNLDNLTLLSKLNLSENQISEIKNLDNLTLLSNLNLFLNQISEIKELNKLTQLFELDLSSNRISEIKNLATLTRLKELYFANNQISEIKNLDTLIRLEELYLANNQISEIKNLDKLTQLQEFDLSANQISEIKNLDNLTQLSKLNLSENKISEIKNLDKLTKLSKLYLTSNQIREIKNLDNLTRLEMLDLANNQISEIKNLDNLTQLSELYLPSNQISEIKNLDNLTQLSVLYLDENKINMIENLDTLDRLSTLILSKNQISEIKNLDNLTQLLELNLSSNQIIKIPLSLFEHFETIELNRRYGIGLTLKDNPITDPPLEIIKQGKEAVLRWFEAKKIKLNEIKIILIGEPKAGKTSLLKRLYDGSFNPDEEQTDGINIVDIKFGKTKTFKAYKELETVTGHFWDFGGQEIMNSTHRFFLTKRAVYLIVLNARNDKEVTRQVKDWMERISSTGGKSPVIIIANQIDVNTGFGFQNEEELKNEYPQIAGFLKISCQDDAELKELKTLMEKIIPQAEMFNSFIDERWMPLKETLASRTKEKHFLNDDTFIDICTKKHSLKTNEERADAIRFLHDLGIVLNFPEIKSYDYYILDPYWITYGVYQILTSQKASELKGIIGYNELDYIINKEEDKKETYKPPKFKRLKYTEQQMRFLVEVLHQFNLCICDREHDGFILPNLLDTSEPIEDTKKIRDAEKKIQLVYRYKYLEKFILPNLMVALDGYYSRIWRTGILLHYNGADALISTYENDLWIMITNGHKGKRECMTLIKSRLEEINRKLATEPERLIPLGEGKFANYDDLRFFEECNKKYSITFREKKKIIEYNPSELLEGIPDDKEEDEIKKQLDRIEKRQKENCDRIIKSVDEIKNYEELIIAELKKHFSDTDKIISAIKEIEESRVVELEKIFTEKLDSVFESIDIIDDKIQILYNELKSDDAVVYKLNASIPLLSLLGLNIGAEVNLKKWAQAMFKKHGDKIFKTLSLLQSLKSLG